MKARLPRAPRLLLAPAIVVCAAAAAWGAFDRQRGLPVPGTAELLELQERWEGLGEEEREHYRRRYVELQDLDDKARDELGERVRRLDEMARLVFRSLESSSQQRILGLDAPKRRELLREMAIDEARAMGSRLLESLPEEQRNRIEGATPNDRLALLVQMRRDQEKLLDSSVRLLAEELEFSEADMSRIESLPLDMRRARFMGLIKRRTLSVVERRGLPEGISAAQWAQAAELDPKEFYLMLQRLRDRDGLEFDLRPNRTEEVSPWAKVRRMLRGDVEPELRVELADLNERERDELIRRTRRERTMALLRSDGLLAPAELESLEACPDSAFFTRLRAYIRDARNQGD